MACQIAESLQSHIPTVFNTTARTLLYSLSPLHHPCLHTFWHAIPTSYSHCGCLILTFNTATFLFLLVPKACTQQQSLMGWHITLIMIGVLALVVSMVIIITVIVISCHQMGEFY